ncbi:uncharacterized protein DS421_3g82440 [Arachis hypogaea]|nr:uncharacterized protein DS421_3g82440 [Arachis hypogaea]
MQPLILNPSHRENGRTEAAAVSEPVQRQPRQPPQVAAVFGVRQHQLKLTCNDNNSSGISMKRKPNSKILPAVLFFRRQQRVSGGDGRNTTASPRRQLPHGMSLSLSGLATTQARVDGTTNIGGGSARLCSGDALPLLLSRISLSLLSTAAALKERRWHLDGISSFPMLLSLSSRSGGSLQGRRRRCNGSGAAQRVGVVSPFPFSPSPRIPLLPSLSIFSFFLVFGCCSVCVMSVVRCVCCAE